MIIEGVNSNSRKFIVTTPAHHETRLFYQPIRYVGVSSQYNVLTARAADTAIVCTCGCTFCVKECALIYNLSKNNSMRKYELILTKLVV